MGVLLIWPATRREIKLSSPSLAVLHVPLSFSRRSRVTVHTRTARTYVRRVVH